MEKKKRISKPKQNNGRTGLTHSEETKEKISKALLGNSNAEKYSEDEAIELLANALYIAKTKKFDFIGEVADFQGVYRDLYVYLVDKFPELKPIYKNILNSCEANCFAHAKKGDIVPSLAIINLKSNHGWTDRIENKTDITTGGKSLNLKDLISFDDDGE